MFKKTYVFYMLLSYFGLTMNSAVALNCDFVAKIHPFNGIDEVEILRAGNKLEKASFYNRRLCPDDVVKVPESLSEVKIKYQSNKREVVRAGLSYKVVALAKPCQWWCKFKDKISSVTGLFTKTEPETTDKTVVASRGLDNSIIKMPLAISDGSDREFFLSADNGAIPLFWFGGKAPYNLTVKDAVGKVIVLQKQLEKPEFSLTLPDIQVGSEYKLTIQSAESSDCNDDNSWICQKPLVVTALPQVVESDNEMEKLVPLLADCEKNWRLEIWRRLSVMPDSEAKRDLMQDLAENDFELCE
jgi:hypothetical protein